MIRVRGAVGGEEEVKRRCRKCGSYESSFDWKQVN